MINYMRNRMPVSEIHLRPVLPDDLKTAPLVVVVVRDPVDRVISAFNWDSPWGGRSKQATVILPSSKGGSAHGDFYDCFATAGKFADAVGAFAARSKDEKRKQTKKRSCEWLATAFLKQDNGQALGAPIVDLNRATAFHDAKELAREHKGCPDAPHCPVFSCHGHLSRGASWYLSNGKTRDALKKKKFWMARRRVAASRRRCRGVAASRRCRCGVVVASASPRVGVVVAASRRFRTGAHGELRERHDRRDRVALAPRGRRQRRFPSPPFLD